MKKSTLAICAAAVTLFSLVLPFAATAATPIDGSEAKGLTVTGGISPGSCAINFSGAFDYGVISSSSLDPTSDSGTILNRIPRRQLKVDCDASTQISLELIDSRSDSVAWFNSKGVKIGGKFWFDVNGVASIPANFMSAYEPVFYGLGTIAEGASVGVYLVTFSAPMVDGRPAGSISVGANGELKKGGFSIAPGVDYGVLGAGRIFAWGDSSSANPTALAGRNFSLLLQTLPAITSTKFLPLNKEIKLDGSSTLVVKYL